MKYNPRELRHRPQLAGEILKRCFDSETHQMFSVYTTPEEFETQQSPVILDLCLRKTRAGESHDYPDVFLYAKIRSRRFQILPV